jgi:AbrB family looped-hinge helix DNA binding protein
MSKISSRGQIILPAKIRRQDGLEAGQEFEVQRVRRSQYLLRRKTHRPNEGLVKLLLACPVKGWFQPMGRTETTDDITPPKLG